MKARLLQARNYHESASSPLPHHTPWHIHNPELCGIPISTTQLHGMPAHHLLSLHLEASEFLLDLLGNQGAWKGWVLHATGKMGTRPGGAGGEYFDIVVVRGGEAEKAVVGPEGDGFEVVEEGWVR